MSIIKFAKLKIPVNTKEIQKEVNALDAKHWQPHMNRHDYEGEWSVLSLRSPGGTLNTFAETMNNEGFSDTLLLKQCPAIQELLNRLHCEKLSARLLKLQPGALIKEHTDKELYFEKGEARLHFPVFTNPFVEFYLDNIKIQMQEGDCWYINANLPHRLANKGNEGRIHLVVDCRVNDWLHHVFHNEFIEKAELSEKEMIIRDKDTIVNTILELRRQTGELPAALADKLERQLHEAENGLAATATDEITESIINFIRSIGITVSEETIEENTFLPGMQIRNGELILDRNKSFYPGDLLHEAGHIAVVPAKERPCLDEQTINTSQHREAEEMTAIAWSYAASVYLGIDPFIVFHKQGYKGGGDSIVENFKAGRFFGTPLLVWYGMTVDPRISTENEGFPVMVKWTREL
jgi:mannose-6-phosphate isomerase-like protein (cupin superfamily)